MPHEEPDFIEGDNEWEGWLPVILLASGLVTIGIGYGVYQVIDNLLDLH